MTLTYLKQNCTIHSLSTDLKAPAIAQNMHHSHLFYPWEVDNSSPVKQNPGLHRRLPSQKLKPRLGLVELN